MLASALKMWTTTYGRIWSECAVAKCPCSLMDGNSTSLQKKNNNNATPSGQSSLRSIFNAIIHMRHTTYRLQNTHAIETGPHTHTTTVRWLQVPWRCEEGLTAEFEANVQSVNVPVPWEMKTAPPYKKGITTMPHRQVNLLSDRSSTQSFTCATRLTDCEIQK